MVLAEGSGVHGESVPPACAKPRLQKPCGGQALRRRQVGGENRFECKLFPALGDISDGQAQRETRRMVNGLTDGQPDYFDRLGIKYEVPFLICLISRIN